MLIEAKTCGCAACGLRHVRLPAPGKRKRFCRRSAAKIPRAPRRRRRRNGTRRRRCGNRGFVENCLKVALAQPRPDPAGMAAGLFAPPSPPMPWVPSLYSNRNRRPGTGDRIPTSDIRNPISGFRDSDPGAGAEPGASQDPRGATGILGSRPGHCHLWRRIQGDENLFKEFAGRGDEHPLARALHRYAIGLAVNGHAPLRSSSLPTSPPKRSRRSR